MTREQSKVQEVIEIAKELEKGVREAKNDKEFKRWLDAMAMFHDYSPYNALLIQTQNPEATVVAGYNTWKKLGRQVRKSQKGIRIVVPMTLTKKVRDANGEEKDIFIQRFKAAYVFDVTQTVGRPLPEIKCPELTGKVKGYGTIFKLMEEFIEPTINFAPLKKGLNGFYCSSTNEIGINESLDELHKIKTMFHEIGHYVLHKGDYKDIDKRTGEVAAESIAYIVCAHLGLDTSEYSFPYVAAWCKGDDDKLSSIMKIINKESSKMIKILDKYLPRKEG